MNSFHLSLTGEQHIYPANKRHNRMEISTRMMASQAKPNCKSYLGAFWVGSCKVSTFQWPIVVCCTFSWKNGMSAVKSNVDPDLLAFEKKNAVDAMAVGGAIETNEKCVPEHPRCGKRPSRLNRWCHGHYFIHKNYVWCANHTGTIQKKKGGGMPVRISTFKRRQAVRHCVARYITGCNTSRTLYF
jgi:hypothetical protein